jgi:DNA-binding CsgD family transcriptional regulator
VLWCTPQAERLLSGLMDAQGTATLAQGLKQLRPGGSKLPFVVTVDAGDEPRQLEFAYISPLGPGEYLFRLSEPSVSNEDAVLRQAFGLTSREAEVLLWIARGKSNRDVSDILGISPRTVNKHLEQVFIKLGVNNRASATALAIRTLSAKQ